MIVLRRRGRVWLALWLGLATIYAATLGIPQVGGQRYAGDEPHHLLATAALADRGNLDVTPEYARSAWRSFGTRPVTPLGHETAGRRDEPTGPLVALLALPAWDLDGADGVSVEWAALAAAVFVAAMGLARRLVPEPFATGGVAAVALSPPALAWSTTIGPEVPAALCLVVAVLLALRARDRPRPARAAACGLALSPLPWLGSALWLPTLVVIGVLWVWMGRRARGLAGLVAAEAVLGSAVMLGSISDRLYGGFTPAAAGALTPGAARAADPGDPLGRATRLVSLWLDRDAGLLRWAPALALAGVAAWALWRSRRGRLAAAVEAQGDVDLTLGLTLAVAGAVLAGALLAPWLSGPWFAGRGLVPALGLLGALVAAGWRRAPRVGAVLVATTLGASAWLVGALAVAGGGWADPVDGPFAGLEGVLPRWGTGSRAATALTAVLLVALAATVLDQRRRARASEGMGA